MNDKRRKKYERRIKIIKALSSQIYLLDARAFKENPDWESNERDVDYLYGLAKETLNMGVNFIIEGAGRGTSAAQVITYGKVEKRGRYHIDYNRVLEKAVERVYRRVQKELPSGEEQVKIADLYFKESNNPDYKRRFEDLERKLRESSKAAIEERLRYKLRVYLESKLENY